MHDAEPTQEPADRIYAVIRHAKEVQSCKLQSLLSRACMFRSLHWYTARISDAESAYIVLQTAQRSQYGPGAVAFEFAQVSMRLAVRESRDHPLWQHHVHRIDFRDNKCIALKFQPLQIGMPAQCKLL